MYMYADANADINGILTKNNAPPLGMGDINSQWLLKYSQIVRVSGLGQNLSLINRMGQVNTTIVPWQKKMKEKFIKKVYGETGCYSNQLLYQRI